MSKRIAIVPARSGSKRIKDKNIKSFFNKPLISHVLKEIKKSNLFSKIHVSTDSIKISNIIKKNKIKIDFLRPKNLSQDKTDLDEVINYIIKEYKNQKIYFDEVWLIYATNPLIKAKYLIKANKMYQKFGKKFSIMSVTRFNKPIEWAYKLDKKKILKPLSIINHKKNSNNIKVNYCEAGMFVVYQFNFMNTRKLKYKPFILPLYQSVDIDDMEDFNLAKNLYKK